MVVIHCIKYGLFHIWRYLPGKAGLANIDGKCVSVLKGLFLNCFKMYFFNSGAFSLVGKYSNVSGRGGGGVSVCVFTG